MLVNRETLFLKQEVSYRSDPFPGSSDSILCRTISWGREGLRMNERPATKSSLGQLQNIYGGTLKTITFDVEVKASGVLDTPPEFGAALKSCGMEEVIPGGFGVLYRPQLDSALIPSCTIYYYQDGIVTILKGCRGTFSQAMTAGEVSYITFTFTGFANAVTDALLAPGTYDNTVPYACLDADLRVNNFPMHAGEFTVDIGASISKPPSLRDTNGYAEIFITSIAPSATLNLRAYTAATYTWDIAERMRVGATFPVECGPIGTGSGNIWKTTGYAYILDYSPGDVEGVRTYDLSLGLVENSLGTIKALTMLFL